MDAFCKRHPQIIVEIKLTQTADAYYQLERYAERYPCAAKVIITKTVVLTISTPESPIYLPKLQDLFTTKMSKYYIIPYQGKLSK
jgi:hypothetical protein